MNEGPETRGDWAIILMATALSGLTATAALLAIATFTSYILFSILGGR